jgi:serine/threonine-protein kinase
MPTQLSAELALQQTQMMPAASAKPGPHPKALAMALVTGTQPDFSHEVNNLLRDRLRQAAILLFFGYLAFFIKGIVFPSRAAVESDSLQLWMLGGVTVLMGIVSQRLCVRCHHVLGHLRGVEGLMFGSSSLLFVISGYCTLLYTAGKGYLIPVTPPWLILIFTYAMFIPNTWRRALVVTSLMGLGPLLSILLAWGNSADVSVLIEETTDFHHVFLETVMAMVFAVAIATFGVMVIRALRTQAFAAQQLGQYRLKRLLGRGGMGEVYLAEHVMLKRPCALKLIRPEKAGDPATLARFEKEVQSTARLTHWNSVEIFDYGSTGDGTFYYVMEYLPGMSFDQIVDMHGPLPAERVIHLLAQACDALDEAHSQGMIHRDIKPGNLFAAKRGGAYDVTKVLDFGLVRSLDQENDQRLTQDGMVTGSPLYMSPEQARGDQIDGRSDIYALGCVAYFLLTGRPVFDETRPIKLVLAHAQQPVVMPSLLRSDIPSDLESIVLRCLEKLPEDRFPDVSALREALLECRAARQWTRDAALDWWQSHGCPIKRELDACISAGIELSSDPSATAEVSAGAAIPV